VENDACAGVAMRDERLGKVKHVEELERACLDRQGSGLVSTVQRALDNSKPNSEPVKLRSERESSRPGTDDEDVEVVNIGKFGTLHMEMKPGISPVR
jgi:hypothetical protein